MIHDSYHKLGFLEADVEMQFRCKMFIRDQELWKGRNRKQNWTKVEREESSAARIAHESISNRSQWPDFYTPASPGHWMQAALGGMGPQAKTSSKAQWLLTMCPVANQQVLPWRVIWVSLWPHQLYAHICNMSTHKYMHIYMYTTSEIYILKPHFNLSKVKRWPNFYFSNVELTLQVMFDISLSCFHPANVQT